MRAAPDVGWVSPDNLHLTLKFLGGVEPGRLAGIEVALARVAVEARPFDLAVRGLGAFPTPSRPRVLWAGVAAGGEALGALARRVDDALAALGFEREARAYSPHVTLGRVRMPRRDASLAAALAAGAGTDFGHARVARLDLMRSDLSPRGARYSSLASWPIGTGHSALLPTEES
jgi:RNA 2',3'-cyclic 3'-phosphodiesterase